MDVERMQTIAKYYGVKVVCVSQFYTVYLCLCTKVRNSPEKFSMGIDSQHITLMPYTHTTNINRRVVNLLPEIQSFIHLI